MELKIKQTIEELKLSIDLAGEEASQNGHASDTTRLKELVEFWESELLKL